MLVKATDLTKGEKLAIQRRRDGHNLTKAAKKLKVPVSTYRGWEAGAEGAPKAAVGKVTVQERCFIMRRREGMTLEQVAKKVKCCRWWLRQMEAGEIPADRLVEYWERRKN